METKKTNEIETAQATFDAAVAAFSAAHDEERAAVAATTEADKKRSAGRSLPMEFEYRTVCARIALAEAREARDAAEVAVKRAGGGLPEERDPRSWNIAALVGEIAPLADEMVELEERIESAKKKAHAIIVSARAERDAAAAQRPKADPLGPVPPVAGNLPAVLLELARARRSGAPVVAAKLATAAGWTSWSGSPELPTGLSEEELIDAAIAGARPPKADPRRLMGLRIRRRELEEQAAAAVEAAQEAAKEAAEAEERLMAAKEQEARRAKEEQEAWRRQCAEKEAASRKRAEAGRAALTAGAVPALPTPSLAVGRSSSGMRTIP